MQRSPLSALPQRFTHSSHNAPELPAQHALAVGAILNNVLWYNQLPHFECLYALHLQALSSCHRHMYDGGPTNLGAMFRPEVSQG